jgi:hypothetical protein
MKAEGERYTVAVDFDGVIHSYTTPWVNAWTIPDPPVEGAIDWLNEISKKFEVVIFTTRGKEQIGRNAVLRWLKDRGFTGIAEVTAVKPPALVYIDDRGYRFTGPTSFPTAQQIHNLRPWNK